MKAIPCPVSPEQLRHLYHDEKLTDEEIVTLLGEDASLKRVRSWRKRFKIQTINRTERHMVTEIVGPLRSLLVGSMLGDGRLNKPANVARYMECHSDAQKAYLQWKTEQWGPWIQGDIKPVMWNKKDGKTFPGWRVETVCHATLNPWHEMFYGEGKTKKSLQPTVVDYVDSFALAIWYLDDGSVGWWPRITFGMDEESRKVAISIFAKFSLYPHWSHCVGNTGNFEFNSEEQANLFLSLVRPHIPECMQYKLSGFGFQGKHYQVRQLLTEETLREYAGRGVPIRKIAQELEVGASTVTRHLEKWEINHPRLIGRPISRGSRIVFIRNP